MDPNETTAIITLNDAAVSAHELYLSYINAGFSEDQAMRLITAVQCEAVRFQMELQYGDSFNKGTTEV